MPLRLLSLFALAAVILMANEQKQVPNCCETESEKLSQAKVKALVKQTEPIQAPCCADMLHISGTVALAISVDRTLATDSEIWREAGILSGTLARLQGIQERPATPGVERCLAIRHS
jgi:hypothetical protein